MNRLFDDLRPENTKKQARRHRQQPKEPSGEPASTREADSGSLKNRPIDTKCKIVFSKNGATLYVADESDTYTKIRAKSVDMTTVEAMYVAANLRSHVLTSPACLLPNVIEVTFDSFTKPGERVPLKCRRLTRERHQDILRQLAELETAGWPAGVPRLRDGFTGELLPVVPMSAADVAVIRERWAAIDEWATEHLCR